MQGNDHSVVQAVLGGNKDAYGALVRAHSAAVFRVAVGIVGNEADAEEVVQEAFLRGYQRLGSFQQRSGFGTWIYRIAVNCAMDRIRQPEIEAECQSGTPAAEQGDPRRAAAGDAAANGDRKDGVRSAAPGGSVNERDRRGAWN